jgi:hypothetical protein
MSFQAIAGGSGKASCGLQLMTGSLIDCRIFSSEGSRRTDGINVERLESDTLCKLTIDQTRSRDHQVTKLTFSFVSDAPDK